jgi:hypothetical protein
LAAVLLGPSGKAQRINYAGGKVPAGDAILRCQQQFICSFMEIGINQAATIGRW